MIVSVVNLTHGKISDERVQQAVRAVNRQIAEDFVPYWSFGATLRLEGKSGLRPAKQSLPDMRGDAVLYLSSGRNPDSLLGYHDKNDRGIPYGVVFVDEPDAKDTSWTATLSHEALELVADPESSLFVRGPHPDDRRRLVFHWFEMCDAVQDDTYELDGIEVSNFVLPLYFSDAGGRGSRNDFLGRAHDGETLAAFGLNPGGYQGFFDPHSGRDSEHSRPGDLAAEARLKVQRDLHATRAGDDRRRAMTRMLASHPSAAKRRHT